MIPSTSYAQIMMPASYATPMHVVMPVEVYGASNLTMSAVATTVSPASVYNNIRLATQRESARDTTASLSTQTLASMSAVQQQSTRDIAAGLPSGVQAPFMAQLLAQSYGSYESQALVAFFESANDNGTADTLNQGLMVAYSGIKYLPSNAGLPRVSLVQKDQPEIYTKTSIEQVQPVKPQLREQAASPTEDLAQVLAGALGESESTSQSSVVTITHQASSDALMVLQSPRMTRGWSGGATSLIKRHGASAYSAAFSRNQEHLVIGETATFKLAV